MDEWEWYKTPHMVHLFEHLISKANIHDGMWQGIEIKRGQRAVGRKTLAEETGISEQSLRTCIKRLKSTNEITIKSTNKFSVITVVQYEKYQPFKEEQPANIPSNQPSINQQSTSNQPQIKKHKNNKNTNVVPSETKPLSKNLYPLAIYILCRGTPFKSFEEFKPIILRNAKVSTELSVYDPKTIIYAYMIAVKDSKGEHEVTLETVGKRILAAKERVETPEEKVKIENLCAAFEKYKDVLFTKSSPLIHA